MMPDCTLKQAKAKSGNRRKLANVPLQSPALVADRQVLRIASVPTTDGARDQLSLATTVGRGLRHSALQPYSSSERGGDLAKDAPELEVLIEVPRGSFLKRGYDGHVDFVSPLPCPFNYGCVPAYVGLEGDLLDAVVLGPRLAFGSRIRMRAWGAITMTDRGLVDDKLICSEEPLSPSQRKQVLRFFQWYARCKGLLNVWRRRPGRNACEGWREASHAIGRARPRDSSWRRPSVPF
jgi:inorganic pyrophosphatase